MSITESTIALIDSLKSTTGAFGLAGTGSEYKIVTELFLYKFFNDKFGYEAKKDQVYGERLRNAEKWDAEYDKFSEDEVEDLFSYLPASVPRLKPEHTLAHLYNSSGMGDFSTLLDATLIDIANINADTFSVTTSGKSRVNIFSAVTKVSPVTIQFAVLITHNTLLPKSLYFETWCVTFKEQLGYTLNPPNLWVPHPQIQPTVGLNS